MGKSQSKQETSIPIQSYIDYVTDKNKVLWEKDSLISLTERTFTKRVSLRKISQKKQKFSNFFTICSYQETKFETYEENDVFYNDFPSFSFLTFFFIFFIF